MTDPTQPTPPHPQPPPVDPEDPPVDPEDPPVDPPTPPVDAENPPVDPAPPPDRPPADEWREPPWFPPRARDRHDRRAGVGTIVVGLVILAIGVYYFLDRTLGIAMPPIRWGSLWPVFLVVLGGLILVRSIDRR